MPKNKKTTKQPKQVETIRHDEASRVNIPTAEHRSVMDEDQAKPVEVRYERNVAGLEKEKEERNRDLDPQLVWRGKDEQDWSDLVVQAPPLYIQEKIHPKVLVDDLMRRTKELSQPEGADQADFLDLFADFNGLPDEARSAEFYQHDAHWTNRMILGDSLQVMASLAEREGLRGKVQCIYIDPPYGIKFNSNFQWSTKTNKVSDGKLQHISREPEQVKAFRDTWRDGIHSYLAYLRERLAVSRDLLNASGSLFLQIGDENVHRARAVLDEVFGDENFCACITVQKTTSTGSPSAVTQVIPSVCDYVLWYARDKASIKYRQPYYLKDLSDEKSAYSWLRFIDGTRRRLKSSERTGEAKLPAESRAFRQSDLTSQTGVEKTRYRVDVMGNSFRPNTGVWKTGEEGMQRLVKSDRVIPLKTTIAYQRFFDDFAVSPSVNLWTDCSSSVGGEKVYVVQTHTRIAERCIQMTTDPGDLVLDPTCGSGTSAYVAEQWGRRWITIDTSRVALALARSRVMAARFSYYLLSDSNQGKLKKAALSSVYHTEEVTRNDIRQGFVYQRLPHITLKSIANNTEIDVIWEEKQPAVEAALAELNAALRGHETAFAVETGGRAGKKVDFMAKDDATFTMPSGEEVPAYELVEWEVPRDAPEDWPEAAHGPLEKFWQARIERQKEIDASIAAKADFEYLYDKPYEDKSKVRVAGPFTVESLSPHRVLGVDENDELIDGAKEGKGGYGEVQDFATMILENLKTAGVQQAHKEDKINFTSLQPWPGKFVCAEGTYQEGGDGETKRAAIFIGPEFGTVSRPDLVEAAVEAGDAKFDVLIACAFNYEAHANEFNQLGKVPVLKARMNADLHMADDLKNTGKGNLFVIFGEPDIDILDAEDGQLQVKVNGVDVFDPTTGEVRSDDVDGIACWFVDTDYNGESFFVRHAYFLGQNDPYKALRTTLKAEINEEAWDTLHSDTSRPFAKPESGRIAVKVINHLGDEVMKVFRV